MLIRPLNEKMKTKLKEMNSCVINIGTLSRLFKLIYGVKTNEDYGVFSTKSVIGSLAKDSVAPTENRLFEIEIIDDVFTDKYNTLRLIFTEGMVALYIEDVDKYYRISALNFRENPIVDIKINAKEARQFQMDIGRILLSIYKDNVENADEYSEVITLVLMSVFIGGIALKSTGKIEYGIDTNPLSEDMLAEKLKESPYQTNAVFKSDKFRSFYFEPIADKIYKSSQIPFDKFSLIFPFYEQFMYKYVSTWVTINVEVVDPDSIEDIANHFKYIDSKRDEIDDVLRKIRNNKLRYFSISGGTKDFAFCYLIDEKLNLVSSFNNTALSIFSTESPEITALYDTDEKYRVLNTNTNTTLSRIVQITISHLKYLASYIEDAKKKDSMNVRIYEKDDLVITHKRKKYKEEISRKGCIVRAHFRHYKSGLVTLVHAHSRKGTNFDGKVVIEL